MVCLAMLSSVTLLLFWFSCLAVLVEYINWILMQGICESAIRCLCSCLITKNSVNYADVNEEHHQFMKTNEQIEEEQRTHPKIDKDYLVEPTATSVANKLSQFLDESKEEKSSEASVHKKQEQGESVQQFTNVIGEEHPYFQLFKDKLAQLAGIFEVPEQACSAQPDTAYPLKLHCYQEGKLNTFKYFFTFPTDYHTYESISNDFELQKKFDPNIEQFKKIFETPEGDAKMIYLCYKKVLIMSSRDFYYVRYTFKKEQEYWNICVSDLSREEVKGKVRGEMLLTATRIVENQGGIDVSVSSTTDMKIPIKLEIAKNRGFAEIRKYLDRVYQHLSNEEGKSII